MPTCPAGHDSTSADFCDVCGLVIGGAAPASGSAAPSIVTTAAPDVSDEKCPECGEPRTGRFCEGCSYDFVAGAARTPVAAAAPTPVASAVAVADPPVAPPAATAWSVVVTADREYYDNVQTHDGPDIPTISFPAYCPDRHFTLSGDQIRIGRISRSRGVTPEIDLTGPPQDPGVSHLHAVLIAQDDGGWAVVDPGSTNGTTINDDLEPIANDIAVPVKDGDRIHVGAWTTITLRGPAS